MWKVFGKRFTWNVDLVSLKNKKKIEYHLLQILLGTFREKNKCHVWTVDLCVNPSSAFLYGTMSGKTVSPSISKHTAPQQYRFHRTPWHHSDFKTTCDNGRFLPFTELAKAVSTSINLIFSAWLSLIAITFSSCSWTFTTLSAISADDKLVGFFLSHFPQETGFNNWNAKAHLKKLFQDVVCWICLPSMLSIKASTSITENASPPPPPHTLPNTHQSYKKIIKVQKRTLAIRQEEAYVGLALYCEVKSSTDLFNVIVFIRATDHLITILSHLANNCGWQKHFRFHWY